MHPIKIFQLLSVMSIVQAMIPCERLGISVFSAFMSSVIAKLSTSYMVGWMHTTVPPPKVECRFFNALRVIPVAPRHWNLSSKKCPRITMVPVRSFALGVRGVRSGAMQFFTFECIHNFNFIFKKNMDHVSH